VVDVREPVLVQADARPRHQLAREPGVELARDDRDVGRQRARGEHGEQLEEPHVAPPGVVVAEEESHRIGSRRARTRRHGPCRPTA
jgi:hypothetical protein